MTNRPVLGRAHYPLLGVLTLCLAIGGVGLTFAVYNKAFTDTTPMTVILERAEEQLDEQADVKVRGVRVGEVRRLVLIDDGKVALEVALDSALADQVPADVAARVVPKTLFGEKYIDLVASSSDSPPIAPGATVRQDLAPRSVQLQEVFDKLEPLLRTVRPADLNATTSSLATALSGRGEKLGRTIDALATYAEQLRTVLPVLQADLALLPKVTDSYATAAPDLLATARSASVTARTLTEYAETLEAALRGTTQVSNQVGTLLARNEESIVRLMSTLRPTLELLAEFAPEYDCVFNGAKVAIKRIYDVFGGDDGPFVIKGRLRLGQSRGVYPPKFSSGGKLQERLTAGIRGYGPNCPVINRNPVGGTPNADIPTPALALIGTYRGLLGLPIPPLDTGDQQEGEGGTTQGIPSLPNLPGSSLVDPPRPRDARPSEDSGGPLFDLLWLMGDTSWGEAP